MTTRPTRATPGGRAYLDLRKAASEAGRPTDELLQLYALEGLLDRLVGSAHADRFVLKGGVLQGDELTIALEPSPQTTLATPAVRSPSRAAPATNPQAILFGIPNVSEGLTRAMSSGGWPIECCQATHSRVLLKCGGDPPRAGPLGPGSGVTPRTRRRITDEGDCGRSYRAEASLETRQSIF